MSILTNENKQLFAEQVGDHIEKLNDLMVCALGHTVDEAIIHRTCLATRLLEGSTNMLGFDTWSRTLSLFRKLLDSTLRAGMRWDEQLSQIVSEILEAEEQVTVEITAGDGDERIVAAAFEGLHRETEVLLSESFPDEDSGECPLQFEPLQVEPAVSPVEDSERSSAIDTLIGSLAAARDALDACVQGRDRSDRAIEDLARAIGDSEFFFAIVRDIVSHVATNRHAFIPRVMSSTVLEGLRNFFDVHVKLRSWRLALDMQSDDVVLDGELARALAVILERCIFDVCLMYESREEFILKMSVRIVDCGSFLEARIFDNGPDYLSETELESYDAAAFYKGLICARTHLKRWGGLLWVEPDIAAGERFRFTLPCGGSTNEYRILDASGVDVAVPFISIEDMMPRDAAGFTSHNGVRYVARGERRVPVYRIDELADGQLDVSADGDRIVIIGLAEKRIGLLVRRNGTAVESIADQLTESDWFNLSTHQLHMGEQEYPVLDMQLVLERMDYLKQLDRVLATSGSLPIGEDVGIDVGILDNETVVPRV